MAITDRLTETLGAKYLRIAAAMKRENMAETSGFAVATNTAGGRCASPPASQPVAR